VDREDYGEVACLVNHRFLTDDVSMGDSDVPSIAGYRQVTDAHLLTPARRSGVRLVTFDSRILAAGDGNDVEVLTTL
jgi:predicted nucleic acid-binding protein